MNIQERIKEFVRRITNKTPQIEAPKKVLDGFVAPKRTREDDDIESFAQSLHVSEKDLLEVPVTFGDLEEEVSKKLAKTIGKIGGELGWTHNLKPTISGKLNGKSFISIKRRNVGDEFDGQTICTENGYYDIRTLKSNPNKGSYKEHLTLEDGTNASFSTSLGSDTSEVYSVRSKNGISLKETAGMAISDREAYEFENFAQPSDELLEEYSKTTGLPIIRGDGRLEECLTMTMRKQDSSVTFPYIVSIEASKQMDGENRPKKKAIKYAYTSPEAYKNGEKPYMIYMDGIDGRTGFSGMFRLQGDSYIDNSTFRRENGEYTFDTIGYDQIMELAGKMPTQLSQRANLAVMGKFRMPSELQQIYEKATSIEQEKEKPSQEMDLSQQK